MFSRFRYTEMLTASGKLFSLLVTSTLNAGAATPFLTNLPSFICETSSPKREIGFEMPFLSKVTNLGKPSNFFCLSASAFWAVRICNPCNENITRKIITLNRRLLETYFFIMQIFGLIIV